MSKLRWNDAGARYYETGVSNGVLFRADKETPGQYEKGVAWNGLTAVTESPTGAEPNALYADNIKYLNLMSVEELEATIEAYTYPDEFARCDGSEEVAEGVMIGQQPRMPFSICYQTKIGNDVDADLGFKLHIMYGAMASPSERAYETINDSPDGVTFSWDLTTTPVPVTGFKPTALLTIDSRKVAKEKMQKLLDILYGTDAVAGETPTEATESRLVMPDEVISILGGPAIAG